MNPIVRVVLVLVRGREILLVERELPDAAGGAAEDVEDVDVTHSLPAAALGFGESFAECAARVAAAAGVGALSGLELRRLSNVSTTTGHVLELAFLAEAPIDAALPEGYVFFGIDALPGTLEEGARATVDGFGSGPFAVDLHGAAVNANVAPPAPKVSVAPPPAAVVTSLPPPLPIPALRPTGFWFAGALIWATALALAVAHGREVASDVVFVAWGTVILPVWLSIGRFGLPHAREEDPLPWRRLFTTLAFGFGTLLFAGLFLGIIGAGMRPRDAYFCLGLIGMGTLAAGRYRARRGIPVEGPSGAAKAARVLGWVLAVVVTLMVIAGVPM